MVLPSNSISPFLTFKGEAEEAINFYTSIFPNSKIISVTRFDNELQGEKGKILNAVVNLMGTDFLAMDIKKENGTDFSWANSYLINCKEEQEFDYLFNKLSENGIIMMGPEEIMEIKKCAWVTDKFGVTWQMIWI